MTKAQSEFIDSLLNQIGFRNSPLKHHYRAKFFSYLDPSVKYASAVITKLLEEQQLQRKSRKRMDQTQHITMSALAAYAFCPASFAIKETFDIEKLPDAVEAIEEHRESDTVDKLITRIKSSKHRAEVHSLTEVERAFYADVLNSKVIIRGRDEEQEPFFSTGREIAGLPDYVFQRHNGTQFHVDERHTWREEVRKPWFAHKVQAYGYLYALKQLRLTCSYLVYFQWDDENHTQAFGRPMIFRIDRSNEARNDLAYIYKAVRHLKKGGLLHFNSNRININKCFSCSVRYYCHHRNGLNDSLQLPYPKH